MQKVWEKYIDYVVANQHMSLLSISKTLCAPYHHIHAAATHAGIPITHRRSYGPKVSPIEVVGDIARIYLQNIDDYGIIDAADVEVCKKYRWYGWRTKTDTTTYVRSTEKDNNQFIHRFLLNPPEDKVCNHLNWNGLDNRRCNLEVVDHKHNSAWKNPERQKLLTDSVRAARKIKSEAAAKKKAERAQIRLDHMVWRIYHDLNYGIAKKKVAGKHVLLKHLPKKKAEYLGLYARKRDAKKIMIAYCEKHPVIAEIIAKASKPMGRKRERKDGKDKS